MAAERAPATDDERVCNDSRLGDRKKGSEGVLGEGELRGALGNTGGDWGVFSYFLCLDPDPLRIPESEAMHQRPQKARVVACLSGINSRAPSIKNDTLFSLKACKQDLLSASSQALCKQSPRRQSQ